MHVIPAKAGTQALTVLSRGAGCQKKLETPPTPKSRSASRSTQTQTEVFESRRMQNNTRKEPKERTRACPRAAARRNRRCGFRCASRTRRDAWRNTARGVSV